MAISLTCTCGARLEIDDKFAGQVIPCPDCQRPLNTTAGTPAPPDLPTSGLALTAMILALVGAWVPLVPLAGIAVGYQALRQIRRAPERIGGLNFARAAMIVGGVCALLQMPLFLSGEVFGIDAWLREWRYGAQLSYVTDAGGYYTSPLAQDEQLGIKRPSPSWGRLQARGQSNDALTLLNVREDAQIVCLPINADDEQTARDRAADRLRQSDLFKVLSKTSEIKPVSPDGGEAKPFPEGKDGDLTLDLQFAGYERKFLLRVVKVNANLYLLAGGARQGRFNRLKEEFEHAFDSFKHLDN